MVRMLAAVLAISFTNLSIAQVPEIEWTKAIGGKGNERANGIATDENGNLIVVGRFQSKTLTTDEITLVKNGKDPDDAADAFILKLDSKGKALWALSAGGFGDDHGLSCTSDKEGNIYVTGYFECETLSFGKVSVRNSNFTFGRDSVKYNCDLWLAKFSPEGKCLWMKSAGGEGANGQYGSIALDLQNNVLVSGIAGSLMDFGGGVQLRSEKGGAYVAKYSNDGRLLWAKGSANVQFQGIDTDKESNVYAGGFFEGSVSFDEALVSSNGKTDACLVKYSPAGKVLWVKNFGGDGGEIASCETDNSGNAYLAGLFFSKTIVAGTDTLKNKGMINHFIAKFNQNGNLLWMKSAGGNNGEGPAAATREFHIDQKGNAYCTGSNWSEFTFAGKTIKPVAGSEDILLLRYDKDGNETWGADYGGSGRNAGRGITSDQKGNVFLTGSFDDSQLNIGNQMLFNSGPSDVFIVKYKVRKNQE
jgi:hypothetical protein